MIPLMTSDPAQYYKNLFSFYESSFIDASNAFAQALLTSAQFNLNPIESHIRKIPTCNSMIKLVFIYPYNLCSDRNSNVFWDESFC